MKSKLLLIGAILIAATVLGACNSSDSDRITGEENLSKDASYAMGMSIGADFLENMHGGSVFPNVDEFIKGMSDVMKGRQTRFDANEADQIINAAFMSLMQSRNQEAAHNENAFLAENAGRPGIRITQSGLQYEVVREGNGPRPTADSLVVVHYEGSFIDGTIFDSSAYREGPAEFYLNEIILGWSEGLQLMSVGSQYIFYIPSALGYGETGYTHPWTGEIIIPPYAALVFIVELIDILE